MTATVKTPKELGEALKRNEDSIEIEGDLVNKTLRIRATGKVAWAVAITAIGVAVYAALSAPVTAPTTAGGAQALGFTAAGIGALSTLGIPATYAAIAIAVAGGGVNTLTSLRKYKEISRANGKLILKRR